MYDSNNDKLQTTVTVEGDEAREVLEIAEERDWSAAQTIRNLMSEALAARRAAQRPKGRAKT